MDGKKGAPKRKDGDASSPAEEWNKNEAERKAVDDASTSGLGRCHLCSPRRGLLARLLLLIVASNLGRPSM